MVQNENVSLEIDTARIFNEPTPLNYKGFFVFFLIADPSAEKNSKQKSPKWKEIQTQNLPAVRRQY